MYVIAVGLPEKWWHMFSFFLNASIKLLWKEAQESVIIDRLQGKELDGKGPRKEDSSLLTFIPFAFGSR